MTLDLTPTETSDLCCSRLSGTIESLVDLGVDPLHVMVCLVRLGILGLIMNIGKDRAHQVIAEIFKGLVEEAP